MIQVLDPTLLLMLSKHLPCCHACETDACAAYGIGLFCSVVSPPEAIEEAVSARLQNIIYWLLIHFFGGTLSLVLELGPFLS